MSSLWERKLDQSNLLVGPNCFDASPAQSLKRNVDIYTHQNVDIYTHQNVEIYTHQKRSVLSFSLSRLLSLLLSLSLYFLLLSLSISFLYLSSRALPSLLSDQLLG